MGNTISKQNKYCIDYPHSDIVNAIYTVLSKYQIEAMCDGASWLLRELLISHKKYDPTQVELICSIVNNHHHVFVLDKKYDYYIDITSEQFIDKNKNHIKPCIGSKLLSDFEELGYKIIGENTEGICKIVCTEPYLLYDNDKPITRTQLLKEIKLYLGIRGGNQKSSRKTRRSRK
jgi:hypothetical protein